jgi:glycosyltransferase involved in cell wall biosynthesis
VIPSETPLVSVVIPAYNYGHYVTEAIESALAQTYPAVEVIVVDDGSNDDTPARVGAFGHRVRSIRQTNQGLSAARNTGICAAQGKVVALLDADDTFHPRKLELQMAYLAAHPETGLLGTAAFSGPERAWAAIPADSFVAQSVTLDEFVIKSRFAPSSAIIPKRCFDAVGLFDTSLKSVEDRDMWIRLAARFPAAYLPVALTWYRLQPGSMSTNVSRMEHYERVVLDKAFSSPELQGRKILRRKALGLAAYSSAFMYYDTDRSWAALWRMAKSFCWWPGVFRVPDVKMPLARVRLTIAILRRLARRGRRANPPSVGGSA